MLQVISQIEIEIGGNRLSGKPNDLKKHPLRKWVFFFLFLLYGWCFYC